MSAINYEFTNGFRAMKSLEKISTDPRIDEIEGAGMDDGRVFIHLKPGYIFKGDGCHLRSVGSATELKDTMSMIAPCDCSECKARM